MSKLRSSLKMGSKHDLGRSSEVRNFSQKIIFWSQKNYFSIIDPTSIQKCFENVLVPTKHNFRPQKLFKIPKYTRWFFWNFFKCGNFQSKNHFLWSKIIFWLSIQNRFKDGLSMFWSLKNILVTPRSHSKPHKKHSMSFLALSHFQSHGTAWKHLAIRFQRLTGQDSR